MLKGAQSSYRGVARNREGWKALLSLRGLPCSLRAHYGPGAEEKAAADFNAMLPFRDTLIKELEGIEGRSEKRRHVKEVWSAKVGYTLPQARAVNLGVKMKVHGAGWAATARVGDSTYTLRTHVGPDAKERALRDHDAAQPHRGFLSERVRATRGADERRRLVKEFWSGLVGCALPPEREKRNALPGARLRRGGWYGQVTLGGNTYQLRTHRGEGAEEKASRDHLALVAHRKVLVEQLKGIAGSRERAHFLRGMLQQLVPLGGPHPCDPLCGDEGGSGGTKRRRRRR